MIVLPMWQWELDGIRQREHPWKCGKGGAKYYNFVEKPELIRSVLEDFKPHDTHPGVLRFYELVEEINSKDSAFESNDCGMRVSNAGPCLARIEILYRNTSLNLNDFDTQSLGNALFIHLQLNGTNAELPLVRVGILKTTYVCALKEKRDGYRIRVSIYFDLTLNGVPFDQLGHASSLLKECFRQFSINIKERGCVSNLPILHVANEP